MELQKFKDEFAKRHRWNSWAHLTIGRNTNEQVKLMDEAMNALAAAYEAELEVARDLLNRAVETMKAEFKDLPEAEIRYYSARWEKQAAYLKRIKDSSEPSLQSEKESKFMEIITGLERKEEKTLYPDSVFWVKDGKVFFERDDKNNRFWCSYVNVWSVFEKKFGMEYNEIEWFLDKEVEKQFGYVVIVVHYSVKKSELTWEDIMSMKE